MLRGEIDEVSMFGPALRLSTVLRMARHSPAVTLQDTVTNLSGTEAEHQLLYHINFGEPLLEEGARFVAPVQRLAPRDQRASLGIRTFDRFTGPEEHFIEQVYYLELTGRPATRETMVMLHNANADRGTALRYRLEDLPCFSLWKNTAAKANGYVTGLEPATAFPNCRSVERKHGRVIRLQPGESRTTTLTLEVLRSRQAVQGAAREIEDIQGELQPLIHPDPIADFS
jgi:hypothetical protein